MPVEVVPSSHYGTVEAGCHVHVRPEPGNMKPRPTSDAIWSQSTVHHNVKFRPLRPPLEKLAMICICGNQCSSFAAIFRQSQDREQPAFSRRDVGDEQHLIVGFNRQRLMGTLGAIDFYTD